MRNPCCTTVSNQRPALVGHRHRLINRLVAVSSFVIVFLSSSSIVRYMDTLPEWMTIEKTMAIAGDPLAATAYWGCGLRVEVPGLAGARASLSVLLTFGSVSEFSC
jgi:hypothetical protein